MADDELTARERIHITRRAEEVEAEMSALAPGLRRWLLRKIAKLMHWCAADHRDYDRDCY